MGKILINGVRKKVLIAATNYYGASFKVDVYDDDTQAYLAGGVPMVEVTEPVTAYSSTINGGAAADVKIIDVTDVTGLSPADRVDINGSIYRVVSVDSATSQIELHRPLVAAAADQDTIVRVGNMGIYRVDLLVTNPGVFILQGKDTVYGLQVSDSVTVKDKSIEEMFTETTVQINENEQIIRETSSWAIIV